jgi:hypothetical protein
MTPMDRKKVAVISEYIGSSFTENDWISLGQITGKLKIITDHPRLFRSLSFGDDDYIVCIADVLESIFSDNSLLIEDVIDHFDVDLWYQQKEPVKYQKIFVSKVVKSADFWKEGYLKVFISHLSSNRERMSALKQNLANWGISAFIAHEDIAASREWRDEVEAGLDTMELLIAVVEPGFKESDWCSQEVGYALGRKIDVIPLCSGLDPYGFFGKIQGIKIKGKYPNIVANEIVSTILKKPQHRVKLLECIGKAFSTLQSKTKLELLQLLESWSIVTDLQLKALIEQSSMSEYERKSLKNIIARVGAFKVSKPVVIDDFDDLDIPF